MGKKVDPDDLNDPPKLLLEEFNSSRELENCESGGSVWLYPEDVSRVIKWLQQLLENFRDCKESDARKFPAPYWGDLDDSKEVQGGARR